MFVSAYYRGAHGILLMYDVTDKASFESVGAWMRDIHVHGSDNVDKILVGAKADLVTERVCLPART